MVHAHDLLLHLSRLIIIIIIAAAVVILLLYRYNIIGIYRYIYGHTDRSRARPDHNKSMPPRPSDNNYCVSRRRFLFPLQTIRTGSHIRLWSLHWTRAYPHWHLYIYTLHITHTHIYILNIITCIIYSLYRRELRVLWHYHRVAENSILVFYLWYWSSCLSIIFNILKNSWSMRLFKYFGKL